MEDITNIFFMCIVNTLMFAMLYILISVGLTLVYSILDIVNFAHGEFYMFGGFTAYVLFTKLHVNYFLTLAAAFLVVGAFGVLIEKLIFKRFRRKILQSFIVSLGLIWIFRELARYIFGHWEKEIPVAFKGIITIGKISFSVERLVITIIGFLLITGLFLFITKTKHGRAMRALAQNPDAAALQGVDINFISPLAFGIGCGLASMAGVLVGSYLFVSPTMGAHVIMKAFIIIILGGLGSIPGCLLGSLVLGFVDSFGCAFFKVPLVQFITYIVIFILLVVRPRGLMGHE